MTPTKGVLYGMVHELAEEHGGLMAIAEHRFYGESLPFGTLNESFIASADRLGLLSVEQAMADYAAIITQILADHSCTGAPVVALGGSYSGKLSAYMRLKYPFLVSMALAASAPIYLDSVGLTDKNAYYDVVEAASKKISPECPAAVKASFAAYKKATPAEKVAALNLCAPVTAPEYGFDELEFYIIQYFATMAMFNYPPTSSVLKAACDRVLGEGEGEGEARTDGTGAVPALAGFKRLLKALIKPANGTCFDVAAQAAGDVPAGTVAGTAFAGSKGSVACSDWSGCGAQAGGTPLYRVCARARARVPVLHPSMLWCVCARVCACVMRTK